MATKNELAEALYADLKESYPSLTLSWVAEEAKKQIAGARPTGGPGMFLNSSLRKAGLLKDS